MWTAAGCGLTPESPAALVDGDGVEAITPAGLAQAPGSAQPGHAAADDGDFAPGPAHPSSARARTSSGQPLSAGKRLIAPASAAFADSPRSSKASIAVRNSKIDAACRRDVSMAAC